MTLYEKLVNAKEDTIFHIGASGGSGFFYIGKAKEFNEPAFNRQVTQEIMGAIDSLKAVLENADTYIMPKAVTPFAECFSGDPDAYCKACEKLYHKYMQAAGEIMSYANNIRSTDRKLKIANKRLRKFVPFYKRDVVDSYKRLQGDGEVIIVEGDERGKYWTLGEYQSGNAEEDEEV